MGFREDFHDEKYFHLSSAYLRFESGSLCMVLGSWLETAIA